MNATTPTLSFDRPSSPARGFPASSASRSSGHLQRSDLFEQILQFNTPPERPQESQNVSIPNEVPYADRSAPSRYDEHLPDDHDDDQVDPNAVADSLTGAANTPTAAQPLDNPSAADADNLLALQRKPAGENATDAATDAAAHASDLAAQSAAAGETDLTADATVGEPLASSTLATEPLTPTATGEEAPITTNQTTTAASPASELANTPGASRVVTETVSPLTEASLDVQNAATAQASPDDAVAQRSADDSHGTDADRPAQSAQRNDKSNRNLRTKWYQRTNSDSNRAEVNATATMTRQEQADTVAQRAPELDDLRHGSEPNEIATAQQNAPSATDDSNYQHSIPTEFAATSDPASAMVQNATSESGLLSGSMAAGQPSGSAGPSGELPGTSPNDSGLASSSANGSRNANADATTKGPAAGTPAEGSVDLSQQEKVRMIQRVARSFNRLGPTGGEVNLRLHPPELGSLNVQVRLEGKSLTAKLTTESSAAREVILENLPVLRKRLAEQGVEITQFLVDIADSGNTDFSSGNSGREQTFEQRSSHREPTMFAAPALRTTARRAAADDLVATSSRLTPATFTRSIDLQA